jgi:hypothetical protein
MTLQPELAQRERRVAKAELGHLADGLGKVVECSLPL